MVDVVKTAFDISLDEPLRALPVLGDVLQGGVTAQSGPETVGVAAELRLVVGFQQAAHDFLQQFVGPRGHAEGTHLAVGFRDEDPSDRGPSVAFMANVVDERLDFRQGHPVHSFLRGPFRECTGVSVDPSVRSQVEVRVEELSIEILQVQTSSASFSDDGQRRFGVSHLAYLPTWAIHLPDPLRPVSGSPGLRLLRGLRRHEAALRGSSLLGDLALHVHATFRDGLGRPLIP